MKGIVRFIYEITYFLLLICHRNDSAGIMGPADIVVKYVEKCPIKLNSIFDWHFRQTFKGRGNMWISFNATSPVKFSDAMAAQFSVAVKTNGGWKPNYYNFLFKNVCSSLLKFEPGILDGMAKSVNAETKCPLPKGTYVVNDYNIIKSNKGGALSSVYPYGEFRVDFNITQKNEVLCCVNIFVQTVPKRERKG